MSETALKIIDRVKISTSGWLDIPAKMTPVSLTLPSDLTFEQWRDIGPRIGRIRRFCTWALSDWMNFGEAKYGETYTQAIDATGFDAAYLAIVKYVGASVEACRRRERLSFSHHRLVAPLEPNDQEHFLSEAEKNGWSRDHLAEVVRDFKSQDHLDHADVRGAISQSGDETGEAITTIVVRKIEKTYYTIEQWKALSRQQRADIIAAGFESSNSKMNAQETDSIEWAQHSLNTVTGCLHDCPFCYARDLANRYYKGYGFIPVFHPHRLSAPKNTQVPTQAKTDPAFRNVFANSMSDLFGQWVPVDWIEATIEMARRNPQFNFLTLTKFPVRAAEFEFPDNWWMGTTVDAQARVANAEKSFAKIKCKTKWLSCEPMLTALKFNRLDLFQWVVMGGSSRSTKTPEWIPPFDWVVDLHRQAREAKCLIYHKANLGLREEMRIKEFPWSVPKQHELPEEFKYLKGM